MFRNENHKNEVVSVMKRLSLLDFIKVQSSDPDEIIDEIEQLYIQYSASSLLNFIYLKLLQSYRPSQYIKNCPKGLLHLQDRLLFQQTTIDIPLFIPKLATKMEKEEVMDDLIEKFSKDPPKIQCNPEKYDASINLGKTSLAEDPDLISDTLASIYAQQGYYGKAIKMYKKLSLLFPEKSCYFADQIKKVKTDKENNQ